MGLRFGRRLSFLNGLFKINVGKTGASLSVGVPGAQVTLGKGGVRRTVGVPGSGLSYSEVDAPPAPEPRPEETQRVEVIALMEQLKEIPTRIS